MSVIRKDYSGRVLLLAIVLGALAVCIAATAQAQDNPQPKVEIFGGYAFLHPGVNVSEGGVSQNLNLENVPGGWGAAATFMVANHIGLTADFGGHYHTFNLADPDVGGFNVHLATIMAGPHVEWRTSHITLFGEGLFGLHF